MVITALSTRQPPQAPSTPVVAQQALSELVNYYRELAQYHRSSVNYHRQLLEQHSQDAEVAEKQLASIEAILHPLTTVSVKQDINGTGQITSLEDKAQDKVSEGASKTLAVPEVTTVEPEESKAESTPTDVKKPETKASKSVTQPSPKKNGKVKGISSKATKTKKPTKSKNTRQAKKSTKAFSSRLPYSEK